MKTYNLCFNKNIFQNIIITYTIIYTIIKITYKLSFILNLIIDIIWNNNFLYNTYIIKIYWKKNNEWIKNNDIIQYDNNLIFNMIIR